MNSDTCQTQAIPENPRQTVATHLFTWDFDGPAHINSISLQRHGASYMAPSPWNSSLEYRNTQVDGHKSAHVLVSHRLHSILPTTTPQHWPRVSYLPSALTVIFALQLATLQLMQAFVFLFS